MPRKNRKEITRETFNNIVSMLQAEKSIWEIAGILNMYRKTVSNHIKNTNPMKHSFLLLKNAKQHVAKKSEVHRSWTDII